MQAGSPTVSVKPSSSKVPLYAFVADSGDVETLKAFAASKNMPATNILQGDISTAAEFLKSNGSPTVLVIEITTAKDAPDQLNALAEACDPDTKVIAIGTVNEYSFYCWLMELGIASYLLKPLKQDALESAWAKAVEPPQTVAGKVKDPAILTGFIGARGGVGATTISVLFTALLAQATGKKTAVVDLDPHDGSVSLLLDVDPSRGLREALEKPDRIDSLFLDRAMHKTEMGFHVLSAEEPMHAPVHYNDHAADTLLKELKNQFDFVVLDLPRQVTGFTQPFLAACNHKFVVTEMTLQGLRDSLRLSDLFRDYLRITPPLFVANRVGLAPKHEMGDAEFKKGLSSDITYHVPFSPDFFMQIGNELESLKNKKAPAYKILQQMVTSVIPVVEEEGKEEKKKGFLKKGK
jgi:pilus assembly protein CpaE